MRREHLRKYAKLRKCKEITNYFDRKQRWRYFSACVLFVELDLGF